MPGSTNHECGGCNSNYSSLCSYSGARYLPLCSNGRVIAPTFDAVSGYQTGYCTNKPDCCYDQYAGSSYQSLGCAYPDSCYFKTCKSECSPVCLPQQAIVKDCSSCSYAPIPKSCNGCC